MTALFLQSQGKISTLIKFGVLNLVILASLCYFLIIYQNWGAQGAAAAVSLSFFLSMILMDIHSSQVAQQNGIEWRSYSSSDFRGLMSYFDDMFFVAIIQFAEELKFFMVAFFAGLISFYELTSVEITVLVLTLFRQVPIQLSHVVFEITNNFFEQYKIEIAKTYAQICISYGILVVGILMYSAKYLRNCLYSELLGKDGKDDMTFNNEKDIV